MYYPGPKYFFKNPNDDEFYSVTAVYSSARLNRRVKTDIDEDKSLKFCNLYNCVNQWNKNISII